jgi:isoquinoline 1-oxidoreductase subunit alpha
MRLTITVNGTEQIVDADADTPLLWVLRNHLRLVGTKFGCGMALCGACTVHLDGQPTRSCVTPLSAVGSKRVTTIEGVDGPVADAVIDAWVAEDVPQCGYCQSGQVMSACALLATERSPDDAAIDRAMDGNLCRCGAYPRIRRAIQRAAQALAEQPRP